MHLSIFPHGWYKITELFVMNSVILDKYLLSIGLVTSLNFADLRIFFLQFCAFWVFGHTRGTIWSVGFPPAFSSFLTTSISFYLFWSFCYDCSIQCSQQFLFQSYETFCTVLMAPYIASLKSISTWSECSSLMHEFRRSPSTFATSWWQCSLHSIVCKKSAIQTCHYLHTQESSLCCKKLVDEWPKVWVGGTNDLHYLPPQGLVETQVSSTFFDA